ncbi:MAG: hypothetical protein ACYC46_03340 [Acidobacteriaceae bacterium]
MTLTAAFRCQNGGILLCADREENDGVSKREVDKIFHIPLEVSSCDIFVASAGSTACIVNANLAIEKELKMAESSGYDLWSVHKVCIETALCSVIEQYASDPSDLGVLVVFASRDTSKSVLLYGNSGHALIPEPYYRADGSGKQFCDYISDRLYDCERLNRSNLMTLAAFIFREVQQFVHGVGLGTDMLIVHDDDGAHWRRFGNAVVKEIEDCLPSLSDSLWGYWKQNACVPAWTDIRKIK